MAKVRDFLKFISKITVEPIMFTYLFARSMINITIVTLFMERSCRISHGHPKHVCENMFEDPSYYAVKLEAQKSANDWIIINELVVMLPAVISILFCGPWSDKYGRKPLIIVPLIGNVTYGIGLVLMAGHTTWPPYVVVIMALPNALLGGYIHMMPLMCYLTDISTKEQRSAKLLFVEGTCFFAYPFGALAGGYIYKHFGYVTLFSCSTVFYFLALVYSIFVVKETKGMGCQLTIPQLLRELFRLKHAKECVSVFTRPRSSSGRLNLFLLVGSLAISATYSIIQSNIWFMYTQVVFDWDDVKYSIFNSIITFAGLSFNAFVAPALTYFVGIGDVVLAATGSVSSVMGMVIMSLAKHPWLFYVGGMVGLLNKTVAPICRSWMTKIVGQDDNGKVFAVASSVESLVPSVGNLVISRLYNATADYFPSAALLFAGFIYLFTLITFLHILNSTNGTATEDRRNLLDQTAKDRNLRDVDGSLTE
ncbi:Uncharacterised protein g6062 [Pycnogonum litorale]